MDEFGQPPDNDCGPAWPSAAMLELKALYAQLGEELRVLSVRCDLSGLCCDFEKSGHVLMSTDLEVEHARQSAPHPSLEGPANTCPHFRSGLCGLREGRPLGCRVYFCDPEYADKMQQVSERYHRRVVQIHERHGLSYRYGRFVDAIRRRGPSE